MIYLIPFINEIVKIKIQIKKKKITSKLDIYGCLKKTPVTISYSR